MCEREKSLEQELLFLSKIQTIKCDGNTRQCAVHAGHNFIKQEDSTQLPNVEFAEKIETL